MFRKEQIKHHPRTHDESFSANGREKNQVLSGMLSRASIVRQRTEIDLQGD
jgi:hypothetical protein